MKEFYFTFAQKHHHEEHPEFPLAHPDGYVVIVAPDYWTARNKSVELFGLTKVGLINFASQYEQGVDWDDTETSKFFKKGELFRISSDENYVKPVKPTITV